MLPGGPMKPFTAPPGPVPAITIWVFEPDRAPGPGGGMTTAEAGPAASNIAVATTTANAKRCTRVMEHPLRDGCVADHSGNHRSGRTTHARRSGAVGGLQFARQEHEPIGGREP